MQALKIADEIESYVIDIRRKIHENPEISGKEVQTMELVKCELESNQYLGWQNVIQ